MRRKPWIKRNWRELLPYAVAVGIAAMVSVAVLGVVAGPGRGAGKVKSITNGKITLDFYDMRVVFTCDNIPEWAQVGQWVEAEWDALSGNLTILGPTTPPQFRPPMSLLAILAIVAVLIIILATAGIIRLSTPKRKKRRGAR